MAVNRLNRTPNAASARSRIPTSIASTSTFTSMTAALHDVLGANAVGQADLRAAKFVRVVGSVTTTDDSVAGPEIRAQYSVNAGSTWAYFDATAGTGLSVFTGQDTGLVPGAWNAVPAAAQVANVLVRTVGFGGDAGGSPVVKQLAIEVAY